MTRTQDQELLCGKGRCVLSSTVTSYKLSNKSIELWLYRALGGGTKYYCWKDSDPHYNWFWTCLIIPSIKKFWGPIMAFSLNSSSSSQAIKKSHLSASFLGFKDQALPVFSMCSGHPCSPSPHLFQFDLIPLKDRRLDLVTHSKMTFSNALQQIALLLLPKTEIWSPINFSHEFIVFKLSLCWLFIIILWSVKTSRFVSFFIITNSHHSRLSSLQRHNLAPWY